MAVTVAIKRCKGCIFWDHFNGQIDNAVMRKLYDPDGGHGQPPRRARHACQLVLRAAKNADGSFQEDDKGGPVKVPLRSALREATKADWLGPHFGQRTAPNFVCEYHTPKHPPYVKPSPIMGVVEQVVNLIDTENFDFVHQVEGTLNPTVVQP